MEETKKAPIWLKEARKWPARPMCRYVDGKPQFARVKGENPTKIYEGRNFIHISEEDFDWLVDLLRGRPMKTSTDEYLMTRLDELISEERSLALDGKENSQEWEHCRHMSTALYNELRKRGWVWSDRISDWTRSDDSQD